MGLFNLVGIISGAVGTAVVGKILASGWLDFSFLSTAARSTAYVYSNLLLLFSLVIVAGGALYLRSYRSRLEETASLRIEDCLAVTCD
jgi:DHA2 family metal-tetracycline-proton antiporter-like MFS transporter